MKRIGCFLVLCMVVGMIGCSKSGNDEPVVEKSEQAPVEQTAVTEQQPAGSGLAIIQRWPIDFPVDKLDLLPDGQRDSRVGYIDNADTFAAIWKVFNPLEPAPGIDFSSQIALFVRNTQFYNRINVVKVELDDGMAEIIAAETLSARPIEERVAMVLLTVPRKGINGVKSGNVVVPWK